MLDSLKMYFYVTRRNWIVYKKDLVANISPTIADPALIMVSLGFGLGAYMTNVSGMSYLNFLAPGLTVATALFTSFFESSYGFYVRMTFENVFKAMLTTPMSPRDIVIGELIWVGLKGALMAIGVTIVLWAVGLMEHPMMIPLLGVSGFLVSVPCGAIGLISAGLVRNMNQFQSVYSFLVAPLYFLSGIFFPLEEMNRYLRWALDFFPLTHGVRMAQAVFWSSDLISVWFVHGGILIIQGVLYGALAYRLIVKKLVT